MSVQVPRRGTRGAMFPRPPGWLMRRLNGMLVNRFRSKRGFEVRGVQGVILETTGARSGEVRRAIVGHIPEGPGTWLIIASMGGAAQHPRWLFNLARNPEATIEFGDGRRVAVRAETLAGADLEAAWKKIGEAAPVYVGYRSKTDREIPVVRLRAIT
jgi:deazaflavin-dependent oxidoreductase (nitroreductase family)